jgi:hypothetical protein
MDVGTRYALAYALSSAAGLRGLLTLLAVAFAVHAGYLHPAPQFAWIGSDGALRVLVAGAALVLLGDKIPFVDHLLHALQTIAKPVAGAIVAGDAAGAHLAGEPGRGGDTLLLDAVMALGGANALLLHATAATVRGASTATTGGFANPILSIIEDVLALGVIAGAFLAPLATAAVALGASVGALWIARRTYRFVRERRRLTTTAVR